MKEQSIGSVPVPTLYKEYIFPSPYQHSDQWKLPAGFEPLRDDTLVVLETLGKDYDRVDGGAIEHAYRMLHTAARFAAGKKDEMRSGGVADLLLLHDVFGRIKEQKYTDGRLLNPDYENYRKYVYKAFERYYSSLKESDADLAKMMLGMLYDQVTLGEGAKQHRRIALRHYEELNGDADEEFWFDQYPQSGEILPKYDARIKDVNENHPIELPKEYWGLTGLSVTKCVPARLLLVCFVVSTDGR